MTVSGPSECGVGIVNTVSGFAKKSSSVYPDAPAARTTAITTVATTNIRHIGDTVTMRRRLLNRARSERYAVGREVCPYRVDVDRIERDARRDRARDRRRGRLAFGHAWPDHPHRREPFACRRHT